MMNKFKKTAAFLVALTALTGCTNTAQVYEDATDAVDMGVNVTVETASKRDVEATVTYTGELVAGNVA